MYTHTHKIHQADKPTLVNLIQELCNWSVSLLDSSKRGVLTSKEQRNFPNHSDRSGHIFILQTSGISNLTLLLLSCTTSDSFVGQNSSRNNCRHCIQEEAGVCDTISVGWYLYILVRRGRYTNAAFIYSIFSLK